MMADMCCGVENANLSVPQNPKENAVGHRKMTPKLQRKTKIQTTSPYVHPRGRFCASPCNPTSALAAW